MKIALLGFPIRHSVSESIYKERYRNLRFFFLEISPRDIVTRMESIKRMDFDAILVTTPYKELMVGYVDRLCEVSERARALNFIVIKNKQWWGYNTDGNGALNALYRNTSLEDEDLLVLGVGPAARAVIVAAKEVGARVSIFNRTREKAEKIADEYGVNIHNHREDCTMYSAVVQATSCGFGTLRETPIENMRFLENQRVLEMIYKPRITRFLKLAQGCGVNIFDGFDMFHAMVELQFKCLNK